MAQRLSELEKSEALGIIALFRAQSAKLFLTPIMAAQFKTDGIWADDVCREVKPLPLA